MHWRDLALVAVSESHSVIEALWHGIDPAHPLHHLPGAGAARTSIHAVYHAIDRLVGRLTSAFPDALTVVFAMGGMGDNRSDVPSMLLLPELMYRHAFKAPLFKQPQEWPWSTNGSPVVLSDTEAWGNRMAVGFPVPPQPRLQRFAARMLPSFVKSLLRRAPPQPEIQTHSARISLNWMPAAAYRRFWHAMPAFALPSYYDGRVRVNLKGREARGIVELDDYQRVLADVQVPRPIRD
jgi:hypothetical protein